MAILRGRLRASVAAALVFAAGFPGSPGPGLRAAPPVVVTPRDVHAAFTLNLTRFVSWPAHSFASPDAPLVIGTFPNDPINEVLDATAQGETFQGRPILTVRLRSLADVTRCHVVFMTRNVARYPAVLERCAGRPILTISDAEGFLELGGHVRFVPQPPRTKLRISVANLRSSRLEARPQLLRLAATP